MVTLTAITLVQISANAITTAVVISFLIRQVLLLLLSVQLVLRGKYLRLTSPLLLVVHFFRKFLYIFCSEGIITGC